MEMTINEVYNSITAKCEFGRAPRLEIKPLENDLGGLYMRWTSGEGIKMRTTDDAIFVDPEFFNTLSDEEAERILAHELAHWLTTWGCIFAGRAGEGGGHGTTFLAVWLWILRATGKDEAQLKAAADWHSDIYYAEKGDEMRAVRAAIEAVTPADAIRLSQPVDQKETLLFWLRFAAWLTLGGSLLAAIWSLPITAFVNLGTSISCIYLLHKFKKLPAEFIAKANAAGA
jgi:hypothetical protein